ncbi:gibberellin 3-beta-dioxygenase 3 [Corylus avellana]|uniref:gibberellin 3-beta-dioxygenase 3 n=1 Tax=Corylus avellana TaxID=13451 RepID=UPI00286D101C|nr:gibberellin 3-beta-dioxygenase 3 [Corylus avellana]
MNSISESFKSNPVNLDRIIPLDFKAVLKLPDSHTWSLSTADHPPTTDPFGAGSVPVIDLTDPNAVLLTRHACEQWGVFQVTNHGIPVDLLIELEFQTRRLFSLPLDQKLLAVRSPEAFTGYGLARISTFFPKLMWSEGFSITGSPMEHARQLWPHDHTKFCDVMEEYQREIGDLTERILGLMLGSLGLTRDDVRWFKPKDGRKHSQALLHLNSYPVCPDPSQAMGLAPHTDSSLLTLLHQSSTGGLQVLRDNVGWVPVHPIAGALVVNTGDLMHILSNGQFKSAMHQVLVNETHHRISIAYFYGPPGDVNISPPTKLTNHKHPPLYRPVTWKEYLDAKAMHFNKALDLIRNDVHIANR